MVMHCSAPVETELQMIFHMRGCVEQWQQKLLICKLIYYIFLNFSRFDSTEDKIAIELEG